MSEDLDYTMPTIHIGPYRIQFFEYDLQENRMSMSGTKTITPVELFENNGYAEHELNKIERLLRKERNRLLEKFRKEQQKR